MDVVDFILNPIGTLKKKVVDGIGKGAKLVAHDSNSKEAIDLGLAFLGDPASAYTDFGATVLETYISTASEYVNYKKYEELDEYIYGRIDDPAPAVPINRPVEVKPALPHLGGTLTLSPGSKVLKDTELTATYKGNAKVSYQWYGNNIKIPSATTNKYKPAEYGVYWVEVSSPGYFRLISSSVIVTNTSDPLVTVDVQANGGGGLVTTRLFFYFSEDIAGISADDIILGGISGVTVTKGELIKSSSTDPLLRNSYYMDIGGLKLDGDVTPTAYLNVTIIKPGYEIWTGPVLVRFQTGGIKGDFIWTAVSNSPFATSMVSSFAYGNGRFFGVSSNGGRFAYSVDNGVTWVPVLDAPFIPTRIAYGNGRFVIGGSAGRIAYSADNGVTWTTASAIGNYAITAITFGNGRFVVGDSIGSIAYSIDNGATWTVVSDSTFTTFTNGINDIAYGNGRFVAVAMRGRIAYSVDNGVTWTAVIDSHFPENQDINGIAYGNGKFVAGGRRERIICSDDGITWTNVITGFSGDEIYSIAYGNGRFVTSGLANNSARMKYSDDGITWFTVTNSTLTGTILNITYGNGRFVAGDYYGGIAYADW